MNYINENKGVQLEHPNERNLKNMENKKSEFDIISKIVNRAKEMGIVKNSAILCHVL